MSCPQRAAHYRPEIDGLRALAVLAVVLYHARVPGLTGGFAGVDVFFAISGYVVISALQRENQVKGSIDWTRFLVRRVRRLLPMLLVTIVGTLFAGYWLLAPFGEFQHLSKSAMAAAGLSANLYLWRYAGSYFSAGVEQMPLMHLWSLSVEEQFYLLTPLVFLMARWRVLGGLARIILAFTLVSFALTVWGSPRHPTATFYLPVTRAWEFGLGALAALVTLRTAAPRWTGAALLAALIASLLWLDEHSTWLPIYTGIPALLTALWLLVSAPGSQHASGFTFLHSPLLRWIGERSYGWYLLHWPLMVFYRKYYLEDVGTLDLLMVSLLALAAAALAHRYIERPARFAVWPRFHSNLRLLSLAGLATVTTVNLAFAVGIKAFERQTDAKWQVDRAFNHWMSEAFQCMRAQAPSSELFAACEGPAAQSQSPSVILWGDSHAYHLRSALLALAPQQSFALSTRAMGGCPPVFGFLNLLNQDAEGRAICRDFTQHARTAILSKQQEKGAIVILAARWEPYQGDVPVSVSEKAPFLRLLANTDARTEQQNFARALMETAKDLVTRGVEVIIVAPVPEQRMVVPACQARFGSDARCVTPRAEVDQYRKATLQLLHSIALQHPSVQIIDPINLYCDDTRCGVGSKDALWYVDDDHLSTSGAALLQPALGSAIAEAQRRIAASSPR